MLPARRLGRGVGRQEDAVELAEQGALLSPRTHAEASGLLPRTKQPSPSTVDWRRGYPHQDGSRVAASKIGPQSRIYLLAGCLFGLACFIAVLVVPKVAPDTLAHVRDDAICASCLALIVPLQALARRGDEVFTRTIVGFCIELKVGGVVTWYSMTNRLRLTRLTMNSRRFKMPISVLVPSGCRRPYSPTFCAVYRADPMQRA